MSLDQQIRRACLPPFDGLLEAPPGVRLVGLYDPPFDTYLHAHTTATEWDLPYLRRFALTCGGPVLDVGCGTGRVMYALADAGLDVVGLDSSAAAITRLQTTPHARITARHGDILALPPDLARHFAAAVVGDVSINMFADHASATAFLTACRTALRPGGALCLHVLTDAALTAYPAGDHRLRDTIAGRPLLGAVRIDPEGPYLARTLYAPATRSDPFAYLTAVRERLWTATTLVPAVTAAGLTVAERLPAVLSRGARGDLPAEALVLRPA